MITLNLSIDFELGWGDLARLTHDDAFYRRVVSGLEQTANVMEVLRERAIPSTWGVVGACCYSSLEELREAAPRAFAAVEQQVQALARNRGSYLEVLFCRDAVGSIAQSTVIELASHGFVHLTPVGMDTGILRDDVVASAHVLRKLGGKEVVSFIPPQNYHWPDEAFAGSGIRYIRHTPSVFGHPYSDPRIPAKFARLWNDFIYPVRHASGRTDDARLLFLRIDRGERLWNAQMALIRRLLNSARGSLYLFSHPHNLDTPLIVERFAQLCDLIASSRDRGALQFTRFVRELN